METIYAHLPALVVIIPLFGGLLSAFTGRGFLPWFWATIVTGTTFALSLLLLTVAQSSADGVSYNMGWWPAEYGIGYQVDVLNASVIAVVALIAFITTIYARLSVDFEIPKDRHHFFYAVWLLAIAGLIGITVTGDTFNIYVLLEISSLTVYTLVAMGKERDRRALVASLKYLILGSIGATFILLGIGYLLMLTGTLNMADMHNQLMDMKAQGLIEGNRTVFVAFAFLMVGLSLKMALWPLHMWLPNAYTYAPSAVSALIASTATKVGVYMAFRFVFTIFGGVYDKSAESLGLFVVLASAGIIISSLSAVQQRNVKRVLAFSSVGQLAYIVMGFSLMNKAGVTASVVHIFNHAVIKGGMFMAVGCVVLRVGGSRISDFRGLGKQMPLTMAAFTVGGIGLVGFPLTTGFISKWYLVQACMIEGYWWAAAIVLAGSLIALVYVWRLVEAIWFHEPERDISHVEEAPLSMLIPCWILIGASVYFGVTASFTARAAESAAVLLLLGGQ